MAARTSPRDVARRVRRVVGALMMERAGAIDLDAVAAQMETSARTLQRRLRDAGLTFGIVVQEARCAAAQELLRRRGATIGDVARVLGYSDHAHFTRAFQRWTGSTPRDFRRGVAPPGPSGTGSG